jgi:hypothetical protein
MIRLGMFVKFVEFFERQAVAISEFVSWGSVKWKFACRVSSVVSEWGPFIFIVCRDELLKLALSWTITPFNTVIFLKF